jgi:hypothetical protein
MHLTEEKSGGGRCCGARFEGKLSTGLVVRFALKNRHRQPGLSGPKSAINGSEPALLAAPKVEYSSTSSQWDVPAPSAAKHYSFIDIGFEGAISRPLYSASFGVIQPRITLGSIAGRDQ